VTRAVPLDGETLVGFVNHCWDDAPCEASRLLEVLTSLPEVQRTAIEFGYFRGLSCAEIALELEGLGPRQQCR
jgi:hypothetical protein